MKIALLISTVSRQFSLFEQGNIALLRESGHEVHCAADYSDADERLDGLDIIRHPIPIRRTPFSMMNWKALIQLKQLIRELKPRLIHCHSPVGGVLARLAAQEARREGARLVYTAHGFHFFKGAPLLNHLLYYPVEALLAGMTDGIVTMNEEDHKAARAFPMGRKAAVFLVKGVGIDTARMMDIPCDRPKKREELGIPAEAKMILHIGEFNPGKNQSTLLRAFAGLGVKSGTVLVLCGRGKLEAEYRELSQALGIADRVIFAGYRNDIAEVLKSADLFVFPSLREGLPVAVMEALAAGVPVICSDIRGNRDLVRHGVNGLLTGARDIGGISAAMRRLLDNADERKRFAAAGQEMIRAYDRTEVMAQMRAVYEQVGL